jgi:hypothetical protein
MSVVAVTRLRLRSFRFLPVFIIFAIRSAQQARGARGYRGGWASSEWPFGFWTATVWDSPEAMRAFRNGGVHLRAMPKVLHWCDEASFVHWEQEDAQPPDPAAAYERLSRDGKLSKVLQPSLRHRAGRSVGDLLPRRGGPMPPARER